MLLAILNRLRFRFSLRALLIAIAIVGAACGWVAAQRRWIRERQEIVAKHPAWGVPCVRDPYPPWQLRIFGEEGYQSIELPNDMCVQEFERIRNLFPEADVFAVRAEPQ